MRIGMIGLGDIARKMYLPLLATRSDAELVGVMSKSTETVASVRRAYRVGGSTHVDDLLALEPDLVFIHAPTDAHHELVSACLSAGIGVYVDKPLAPTLAQCEDLAVQAARAGTLLAVGFNRRFAPMYLRARDWLADGGELAYATMEKHRAGMYDQSPRQAVFDDLIHVLDTLCWLLGPAVELSSSQLRIDDSGRFTRAMGSLRAGRSDATFAMVRASGADTERLALHGSGRAAEISDLERGAFDVRESDQQVATFGSWESVAQRRGFDALVRHVLDCVGAPDRCEVGAERVLPTHRLAEAVTRAAGG